jgi:hypothetical protein
MKNFSNYTDFDCKENLHFESKVVHGALGHEPITGAVAFRYFKQQFLDIKLWVNLPAMIIPDSRTLQGRS